MEHTQNSQLENKGKPTKPANGVIKINGGYSSMITKNGIRECLGVFSTKEEAKLIYDLAQPKHRWALIKDLIDLGGTAEEIIEFIEALGV